MKEKDRNFFSSYGEFVHKIYTDTKKNLILARGQGRRER